MSSCLAEVLFGHIDRDHGGILFNNRISVYENSVTRLVFEKRASRDGNPGNTYGIWIPHPNYLIESCLLMAAVYGNKDPDVIALTNKYLPKKENNLDIDLCKVRDSELLEMFEAAKIVFCPTKWTHPSSHKNTVPHSCRWKFLFALFHNSILEEEIQKVLEYDMDIEVTKSIFTRSYSEWSSSISTWGEL